MSWLKCRVERVVWIGSRQIGLTQSCVIAIISCVVDFSCLFRLSKYYLFSVIVSSTHICISQGSVEMQLRRGRLFNNRVLANFSQSALVKEFVKSINIGQVRW